MSETDDLARLAYLAEGNAHQARKRVAADVLIRDGAGRVLLVDPTYKPDCNGWCARSMSPTGCAVCRSISG